jgi:hypothetical protein
MIIRSDLENVNQCPWHGAVQRKNCCPLLADELFMQGLRMSPKELPLTQLKGAR